MKATDLRIGNWVLYEGKPVSVPRIDCQNTDGVYRPIPLTPEIIQKFKLEMNPFKSYDCVFEVLEKGLIFGTDTNFIKIEFVHQLQNFIHAITGKDIEVNLSA